MGTGRQNLKAFGHRQAVFLDRDGVVNRAVLRDGRPYPPDPAAFEYTPGLAATLAELRRRGYLLFIVTNQPDVARGRRERAEIDALHARITRELDLDGVYVCYHDDADQCECRKPKAGLIFRAQAEHGVALGRSYVVGDRWRDVDAAAAAGCASILIDYGYAERLPRSPPTHVVKELTAILDHIPSLPA